MIAAPTRPKALNEERPHDDAAIRRADRSLNVTCDIEANAENLPDYALASASDFE